MLRMGEQSLSLLRRCSDAVIENLDVTEIKADLLQSKICDWDDFEIIEAEPTRSERVKILLQLLPTRCSDLRVFTDILERCGYQHLISILSSKDPRLVLYPQKALEIDQLETVLKLGGVPCLPEVHVQRPTEKNLLREALYAVQNNVVTCIVLHGMHGSGKSVLAAEVLRDPKLIGAKGRFTRVLWLKVGHGIVSAHDSGSLTVDQTKLLGVMHTLAAKLQSALLPGRVVPSYTSIEEAREKLRSTIVQEYPQCLLVLDDVPNLDVAKALDFNCVTLVTTANEAVANGLQGFKRKVALKPEFTEDQSLELFARTFGIVKDAVPNEARLVHEKTRGYPFMISLVAGYISESTSLDAAKRWATCLERLESIKKQSVYDFSSFAQMVDVTLNGLDKDLRERFLGLAVFDMGVKLTLKCLKIYWAQFSKESSDAVSITDQLNQLKQLHLVEVVCDEKGGGYYCLHDLLHRHIKRQHKHAQLQNLHDKLLDAYLNKYGSYKNILYDGYIHGNVGRHIRRAGRKEDFAKAFLDLEFLYHQVRYCGTTQTLVDFVKYGPYFGEQHVLRQLDFQQFLSANALLLSEPDVDFYQCAMLRASDSCVYKDGKTIIQRLLQEEGIRRFYVDICNSATSPYSVSPSFAFKAHDAAIYRLWYFEHADRPYVVSCSKDGLLLVSSLLSNKEVFRYILSTSSYPQNFALDPVRQRVILAYDNRLHLRDLQPHEWQVHFSSIQSVTDEPSLTPENSPEVAGDGSPNVDPLAKMSFQNLLATPRIIAENDISIDFVDGAIASNAATDRTDGNIDGRSRKLQGHSGRIVFVELGPDGRMVASCDENHSICYWDIKLDKLVQTKQVHKGVVTCCRFIADGRYIITCGQDAVCHVWKIQGWQRVASYEEHTESVLSCVYIDAGPLKGCVASLDEVQLHIWKLHLPNKSPVNPVVSQHLLLNQGLLGIDDLSVGFASLRSLAVSGCGCFLAVGLDSNVISLVDIGHGRAVPLKILHGHVGRVCTLEFYMYRGERMLLSGGEDGIIMAWSIQKIVSSSCAPYKPHLQFTGNIVAGVTNISKAGDGSTGRENEMILIQDNSYVHTSREAPRPLCIIDYQGTVVHTEPFERSIALIETAPNGLWGIFCTKKSECFRFRIRQQQSASLNISSVSVKLFRGGATAAGNPKQTEVSQGIKLDLISIGKHRDLISIIFSSCNRYFGLAVRSSVKVFDARDNKHISDFNYHDGTIVRAIFLPSTDDNSKPLILSCSESSTAKNLAVWNCVTGKIIRSLSCASRWPNDCDVAQNGEYIAVSSPKSTIQIWTADGDDWTASFKIDLHPMLDKMTSEVPAAQPATPLNTACPAIEAGGHSNSFENRLIRTVRFTPDSRLLAAAGEYFPVIFLFSTKYGDVAMTLDTHGHPLATCLSFSPDSAYLVCMTDQSIRWWYVGDFDPAASVSERRGCLQRFSLLGPNDRSKLIVSPDFKHFITVDLFGNLYILQRVLPSHSVPA